MAAAAEVEKKHTLTSSDGEQYVVEEAVAMQSQTMKNMIEDGCGGVIPLPNVHSKILALVIEYCRKHAQTPEAAAADADKDPKAAAAAADAVKDPNADLKTFDENFVKVDQTTLFDLILAANYLDIKGLLDLTCQAVANMIKDKTPEEIRNTFNIKNDFTKEEEDEIRRENQWAFE